MHNKIKAYLALYIYGIHNPVVVFSAPFHLDLKKFKKKIIQKKEKKETYQFWNIRITELRNPSSALSGMFSFWFLKYYMSKW